MNTVPLEVALNITSHLTLTEKVTLSLVSRYWYNLVKYTNLFSSLSIKHKWHYEQAMKYFESNETLRSQVRSLTLIKINANTNTILDIPLLFPHLEDFHWADYLRLPGDVDLTDERLKSWQKIKKIQELNSASLSSVVLQCGVLSNLTRLKISFVFSHNDCSVLADHLQNAPNLNTLELSCIAIGLQTLEKIHANAPKLETLYLGDINHRATDFDLDYERNQAALENVGDEDDLTVLIHRQQHLTKPAKKLQNLKLKQMKLENRNFGFPKEWLTYISKKYLSLKTLIVSNTGTGIIREHYYESGLVNIFSACQDLEFYETNLYPLTYSILKSIDKSQIELKEINILGEIESQLEPLIESSQRYFTKRIAIKSDMINSERIVKYLTTFSNLKELTIQKTRSTSKETKDTFIQVNTIISQLKNLESLTILSGEIGLSTLGQNCLVNPCIKAIHFDRTLFVNSNLADSNFDYLNVVDYISKCCPNLSKLYIQGQIDDISNLSSFNLHFDRQYFSSIRITILGNMYYVVKNGTRTTHYQLKGKKFEIIDQCKLNKQFHISIKFKGFASLVIGGVNIPKW